MIDLANHGHSVVNNNELRMQKPSNVLSYVVRATVDMSGGTEVLQTYSTYAEFSRYGRSRSPPLATDNLLENTDGALRPRQCFTSRGGSLLLAASIYADGRSSDDVIAF